MVNKKVLLKISCAIVFIALLAVFLPQAILSWAAHHLEREVSENCQSCELKLGRIEYSLLNDLEISFNEISFLTAKGHALELRFSAPKVKIHFDPLALFSKFLNIKLVEVAGAQIELIDTDKAPPNRPLAANDEKFHFLIAQVKLTDTKFKYTRKQGGTIASIHLNHIRGEIGEFTDLPDFKKSNTQLASAHFNFSIEQKGRIEINIDTPDFLKFQNVMLSLSVNNQDLAELNGFLEPNVGVSLKGTLQKGQAFVNMTGRHLQAKITAIYRDFDMKVEKTADRSGLETYFTNLGAGLVKKPENISDKPRDQNRQVEADRNEHESICGFILRGLKEAAIKLAM